MYSGVPSSAMRHVTAQPAGAANIQDLLSKADWKTLVTGVLPPDIAEEIPLDDVFGHIIGLPTRATQVPWDGPDTQIIEHEAHTQGHAALFIKEHGVLIAGDMLSDTLIPFLDLEYYRSDRRLPLCIAVA
jgi:glyoxylase-like metal-dependent hydrolase (beta-lactamase superfamily II)